MHHYCKSYIMLSLIAIVFTTVCIELASTTCSNIPSGLYCINLQNGTDNKIVIPQNDTESQKNDVRVIYLRNSSGEIDQDTFLSFPQVKSLDIQFSSIDSFSLDVTAIDTLYLMYNSKFPTLSAEFMEECCQNLSILFIVGNNELKIEDGAFKHMAKLTHLTISKQNITHLTKDFFEGLEKLTYLNLKQNEIANIDGDAFKNMTDLNRLVLSHNNFTELESDTFQNLKVLEALEIQGLDFNDFNISIFNGQKDLKVLELPTILIKEKLELSVIMKTFPLLETFGFQNEDKEDSDVAKFIEKCKATGYNIKFTSISDL